MHDDYGWKGRLFEARDGLTFYLAKSSMAKAQKGQAQKGQPSTLDKRKTTNVPSQGLTPSFDFPLDAQAT